MCIVSMIGDHYRDTFPTRPYWPHIEPHLPSLPAVPFPTTTPSTLTFNLPSITREEFDALKRDVEDMKELLKRAKAYDEANGEPDCEIDEKMALLKKIAAVVGIDLDEVLTKKGNA